MHGKINQSKKNIVEISQIHSSEDVLKLRKGKIALEKEKNGSSLSGGSLFSV